MTKPSVRAKNFLILFLQAWVNLHYAHAQETVDSFTVSGRKAYIFSDLSWTFADVRVQPAPQTPSISVSNSGPWSIPDQKALFSTSWLTHVTHPLNPRKPVSGEPLFFSLLPFEGSRAFLPHSGGMSSPYGPRWGRNHNGVDIVLRPGQEVYCTFDGVVRYARYNNGGYGNLVIVRHHNGLETYYAHLDDIAVSSGKKITAGDVIGHGGSTGHSSGPHLHFEVRILDYPVNPELVFDFVNRRLKADGYVIHEGITFISTEELIKRYNPYAKYDLNPAENTRARKRNPPGNM